jgi:ATP/maltotriose-dependent transcriptional regulator MalT
LAIELAGAGVDRAAARRSAREALTAIPLLMSVSAAALPETISVLLFADEAAEARAATQQWLQLARRQGSLPSAAVAEGFSSLVALYGGEISDAVAYGLQGMAGTSNIWISTILSSFVVRALIDRGELDQASTLLAEHGLTGDLPPSWPHNLVRHGRAPANVVVVRA